MFSKLFILSCSAFIANAIDLESKNFCCELFSFVFLFSISNVFKKESAWLTYNVFAWFWSFIFLIKSSPLIVVLVIFFKNIWYRK
jgi:hypothetical protein